MGGKLKLRRKRALGFSNMYHESSSSPEAEILPKRGLRSLPRTKKPRLPREGGLKRLRIYWKIWWTSSILSFESVLENRLGVAFFISGKIVRFIFFIFFLVIINRQVQQIAGYSLNQMITFFLMFNLLDLFGQLFFRGIYWFRDQVVTGEFDFKLTKPVSPLFQALTRHTDILDLPLLLATIIFLFRQGITLTTPQAMVFLITLVSGMVIVTAIH